MGYIIALIVLAVLVALVVTIVGSVKDGMIEPDAIIDQPFGNDDAVQCCGAHDVCVKDSLLSASDEIVYFNDEELDGYRGRQANSYTDKEIDEFREVLFTMHEGEVAGWLKSLRLRSILPPDIVREEALMIVAEKRNSQ